MSHIVPIRGWAVLALCCLTLFSPEFTSAQNQPASGGKKPNIVFIMGDDVGWFNIGAYHRGMMSGKTPNLDKLASQGMLFTDYYAEASCTAGRASFITGEIPLRTGLTTVGQAGADVGMPDKACTIATALKAQGYATGQFGKNHLGDLNKYPADAARLRRVPRLPVPPRRPVGPLLALLPEGSGLPREVRPAQRAALLGDRQGRRHRSCRAGARSASRRFEDDGPLPPHPEMDPNAKLDMETVDDVFLTSAFALHGQGQEGRQAVLRVAQHDPHARLDVPLARSTRR